jgi:hypothetical protein
MTDIRKAAEMALEFVSWFASDDHSIRPKHKAPEIAEALRQALAQPEKETITLDRGCWERGCVAYDERDGDGVTVSIREWVGLTDEEIENLWEMAQAWNAPKHFYILISAKLKEKNV